MDFAYVGFIFYDWFCVSLLFFIPLRIFMRWMRWWVVRWLCVYITTSSLRLLHKLTLSHLIKNSFKPTLSLPKLLPLLLFYISSKPIPKAWYAVWYKYCVQEYVQKRPFACINFCMTLTEHTLLPRYKAICEGRSLHEQMFKQNLKEAEQNIARRQRC